MAGYKGHLAGGAVAFAFALVFVTNRFSPTLATTAEWLFFSLAGSLFPDIDIKSKGQKYFYWFILLLLLSLSFRKRYDLFMGVSIISVFPMLVNHRGIFHRPWFVIGAPLLLWYLISLQFPGMRTIILLDTLFFIAGAVSHLWLDMGFRMFRL